MTSEITLGEAKTRLDQIIRKARVDLYKPIQVAEVLYHLRTDADLNIDLLDVDSYKNLSLKWRNEVTRRLLGKASTSSAQFQHNLWQSNAMPPPYIALLHGANLVSNGAVERYIYLNVQMRQNTVAGMIALIEAAVAAPRYFKLATLLDMFVRTPGIARSIDKAYEIVVYSLLETVVTSLGAEVTVAVAEQQRPLLNDFNDLATMLLGLSTNNVSQPTPAHIYRVGVTNAADRGLDMWANFGLAIQVKHLTLDKELANRIVDQVESDSVVIVCRDSDEATIQAVMKQIGWGRRVRAIIRQTELEGWYDRCLNGAHADTLAEKLLTMLLASFRAEFPLGGEIVNFMAERGYDSLVPPELWQATPTTL